MSKQRVVFRRVPDDIAGPALLGGYIFDKKATLGPKAVLDFRNEREHPLLLRDLVSALNEYASPGQIASGVSLQVYGTAIRQFLRYCSVSGVPKNARMMDVDTELLLRYRAHLRIALSEFKTSYHRVLFGNLCRLLTASQKIGLWSKDFETPRNYPTTRDSDRTQPYSMGEALDIESACRTHIRELVARLERGQTLLSIGKDPRGPAARDPVTGRILSIPPEERQWNQLQNLLWFVVNVMDGKYVKYPGRGGSGLSSFNNATNGCFKGPYRKDDVFSHLYPFAEDLIPFINLLAKTTGRNESSILNLKRDCLQAVDERYILWYPKDRGASRLYKKVISSEGPFSPVALIKTLLGITEPLVRFAEPEDKELLFLGFTLKSRLGSTVKRLDPAYIKYQMNRDGGWADRNGLVDDSGAPLKISLRRWRVFYLTLRYKRTGQLGRVSRDAAHTLSRTTISYLDNQGTKHIHEQATEAGIKAAVNLARPAVLPDESVARAAELLGTSEPVATGILKGEQDVFFASCKDFYNRPGGPENTPCDKPWGCLECSNAVITRHVLPRVCAFKNFMAEERRAMPEGDWDAKFGKAWQILQESIFPKFSAQALSEAEAYAANERLYIPLALKAR